jgi:nicotinate-nucleotide adenylyltransferase
MTAPSNSAASGLGVFGGTFNPIHVGHLRAADEIVEALGLERMLFVPSARPPHKTDEGESRDDTIAPAADRLEWVRLAIADNSRFEVDPIEVERAGPSYLVDTLRVVAKRTAPEHPVFVVGRDAFQEIGDWREPRTLFQLAHFAVITRPPLRDGTLADWLPDCVRDDIELAADGLSGHHRTAGSWVRLLATTALDVSASAIRARLREGLSTRYLMPEPVRRAVLASGCYRKSTKPEFPSEQTRPTDPSNPANAIGTADDDATPDPENQRAQEFPP